MGPERTIENKLMKKVQERKGMCLKLVVLAGIPDRLVLLPVGKLGFIEAKRDLGEVPRRLQCEIHRKLRKLGFKVFVLGSEDDIEAILDAIQGTTTSS